MSAKPSPGADPRPPPKRRRWPLALLALAALAASAHALAWLWLVLRLEDGVADWAAQRRAEGWTVAHGPPARGGWPLAAALAVPQVALRRAGFAWESAQVTLTLAPRSLDRLTLGAAGAQALEVAGQRIPAATEGLAVTLPLDPRGYAVSGLPRAASLAAIRLRFDLPAGPIEIGALRLDLAAGDGRAPEDPLLRLRGTAATLALPRSLAALPGLSVLGPGLDRLGLDLVASGPWPGIGGTPTLQAARWRDGGGTLEAREIGFGWGAARLGATALLALDAGLQPAGEGMLRLAGAGTVLEAAQAAGMIGRREVAGAQMLLALMQRPPPEGGPPQLEVPLMLERRRLSLGGMSLAQVPPLPWPR